MNQKVNLQFFIDKIQNGEPFRFLRFGDGEFWCANGEKKMIGKNEHGVFPAITEDIRYILSHLKKEHYNGLQPLSLTIPHLVKWIPEWDWCNADVFHEASIEGKLQPFFEALKGKKVVIVSSQKMMKIKPIIDYYDFITVKPQDCYIQKAKVLKWIEAFPPKTIFLFAASRLSVPAIYHSTRDDCTFIDVGSLLDPYIGVSSRVYHSNMTPEIIKQNTTK